ncbi:PREDICTED: ADM2 [Bison bison bison]|uniref:ADM2 n=1 Tax=Bison bison bison TaxID=43346 RepID=A0A6P3HKF0_BISBB|nr:PREDICTED: ADM2 [Bison bison bison]
MARLLTVTLGCISLLYLQLPGALSLSLAGSRPPTGHREPPARTPASGSQPQYPAALPAVWQLHQALQPKKTLSPRLWQLVGSAGPRDSAPVDPSSPHSYG